MRVVLVGVDQEDDQERDGVIILITHVLMDFKELHFNYIIKDQ